MKFTASVAAALLALCTQLPGQPPAPTPAQAAAQAAAQKATAEDHQNMMDQLGIKALRPGPSGIESAPNHANYEESTANPFPNLPDVLTLKNGKKVTTPAMWWNERRPEIIEDFDREVYGRVPKNVPKVTWTVTNTANANLGSHAVVGRQLVGHVDNAGDPAITVDIQMVLVTPANAKGPVPVMMMFGFPRMPGAPLPPPRAGAPAMPNMAGGDPPATEQLIADGWGYVTINPTSVQADNGAGLTAGIIGLVNHGEHRKPEDWGALRAWAWGASRALDYLETEKSVDAKHVGIEGVSRYGKAALVTMAYDTRFAVVLIGSSGEGGAKLHRRNWGEAVENLTGSGEYHWMAGNFLKYGTAESSFGSKTPGDLPVDAHELIALCAPRLTFVSYGVPEKGDAKWLDHQGSYMAAIAAQPVFRLLGAKALGKTDDYHTEKMPAVNVSVLDGQLAWRQHDGGHTDAPNWKYFIPWADKNWGRAAAYRAAVRTDQNSMLAHLALLEKAKKGGVDVYFEGDSITRRWDATDYPKLMENWNQNFYGWNAGDFGWGADKVENILWRLDNGELDGVNPKVIVLLAGTNNLGSAKADEISRGLEEVVRTMQQKAPNATIIVTGIFPRYDKATMIPEIDKINADLAKLADGKRVRYLSLNGKINETMLNAKDKLHPELAGYQVWADALKPMFTEILGPPAKEDHAPPPTGDPSASRK
jgi:lysophospholipase L1-like esterase